MISKNVSRFALAVMLGGAFGAHLGSLLGEWSGQTVTLSSAGLIAGAGFGLLIATYLAFLARPERPKPDAIPSNVNAIPTNGI